MEQKRSWEVVRHGYRAGVGDVCASVVEDGLYGVGLLSSVGP